MKTIATSRIETMSPQFLVADINRSVEFYTKKLGFEVKFRYEDFYVGIEKDGCSIHLKSGEALIEERGIKKLNEGLDIVFGVSGVEELYNDFVSKDIDVVQPLCDRPYGREFYIADPDGYILAFLES
jgi:catechol 2,3-dioxygenase-like lactoylglutathione lyase family enzyme